MESSKKSEVREAQTDSQKIEKTITFEKRVTVQTCLPKPYTTINLKNRSTRERKAILFMKLLWEHGYRKEIPDQAMRSYVERFLGGFRQTVQAYLGHFKIVGVKDNKRAVLEKGLFEKRRWAYFNPYRRTWILNHQIVPLPYHYCESLVSPTPLLPNSDEKVEAEGNMEKISLSQRVRADEELVDALASVDNKNNNTISVRERNFEFSKILAESESIPSAAGEALTRKELQIPPSVSLGVKGNGEER